MWSSAFLILDQNWHHRTKICRTEDLRQCPFSIHHCIWVDAEPNSDLIVFQDVTRSNKNSIEEDSGHGASSETESQTASSRPDSPSTLSLNSRERSNSIGSNSGGWIVLGSGSTTSQTDDKAVVTSKVKIYFFNLKSNYSLFLKGSHNFS